VLIALVFNFLLIQSVYAATFSDDFETGDLSKTQNGFTWNTQGTNPTVITSNLSIASDLSLSGSHVFEFIFKGNPDPTADAWSEQRFQLGGHYSEVWFKVDLHIPANYYCRGSDHNKGPFLIWSGPYGSANSYLGANFESWCVNGSSFLTFNPYSDGINHGHYATCLESDCTKNNLPSDVSYSRGVPFVDLTRDLNKWHEWIIHLKPATTSTSNDGLVEVWKDGVKVWYNYNLFYHSNTQNYFDQGYTMGYSNSGFDQDTIFLEDNFEFSTNRIVTQIKAPLYPNIK